MLLRHLLLFLLFAVNSANAGFIEELMKGRSQYDNEDAKCGLSVFGECTVNTDVQKQNEFMGRENAKYNLKIGETLENSCQMAVRPEYSLNTCLKEMKIFENKHQEKITKVRDEKAKKKQEVAINDARESAKYNILELGNTVEVACENIQQDVYPFEICSAEMKAYEVEYLEQQKKSAAIQDNICHKISGAGKFTVSDVKTGAICNLPSYIKSDLVGKWKIELPKGDNFKYTPSDTEVVLGFLEYYGRSNLTTLTKEKYPILLSLSKEIKKDDNLSLSIVYLEGVEGERIGYISSIRRTVCAADKTNSLNGKNSFKKSLIDKYGQPQKEISALLKAKLLKKEIAEAKEIVRDKLDKLESVKRLMTTMGHPEAGLADLAMQMIRLEFESQETRAVALMKFGQSIVELIWEDPSGDILTVTEKHNQCGESSQFEFLLQNKKTILSTKDSLKAHEKKNAINAESPTL